MRLFEPTLLILTLVLALFCTLIPYALIAVSSKKVTGAQMALLLLMEPLSATLLGWLVLYQEITIFILFGGICISIAVLLASKSQTKI